MSKPTYEELESQLTLSLNLLNRALPLFGDDMPDVEEEAKVAEAATDLVENGPFSERVIRVQSLERVLFLSTALLSSIVTRNSTEGSFKQELARLVDELNAID